MTYNGNAFNANSNAGTEQFWGMPDPNQPGVVYTPYGEARILEQGYEDKGSGLKGTLLTIGGGILMIAIAVGVGYLVYRLVDGIGDYVEQNRHSADVDNAVAAADSSAAWIR